MDISPAAPAAERVLTLEVVLSRNADRSPKGVAQALRDIAAHLEDDFTDTDEGLLRKYVSHFLWEAEPDGTLTGDTIGYWNVTL